jgi:hypothetical protein
VAACRLKLGLALGKVNLLAAGLAKMGLIKFIGKNFDFFRAFGAFAGEGLQFLEAFKARAMLGRVAHEHLSFPNGSCCKTRLEKLQTNKNLHFFYFIAYCLPWRKNVCPVFKNYFPCPKLQLPVSKDKISITAKKAQKTVKVLRSLL